MSKHTLEILFESKVKIKILKFLFRNNEPFFTLKDIASRIQETQNDVLPELNKLIDIGLIKLKK